MAGSSRQHRGEKRRKELARQAKQKEKRERRAERKPGEVGSGPPIDWEAAPETTPEGVVPGPAQGEPQESEPADRSPA